MCTFCQQCITSSCKATYECKRKQEIHQVKKISNKDYHYVLGILSVREMEEEIFGTKMYGWTYLRSEKKFGIFPSVIM